MTIHDVHHVTSASVGHVGFALIVETARVFDLDDLYRKITKAKQAQVPGEEILRIFCGHMCQGKTNFDHVRTFRKDAAHAMVEDAPIIYQSKRQGTG